MTYRVDLQDLQFQLFEWLELDELLDHPRFEDWDREGIEMVLAEAVELATRELASINVECDRQGVTWEDGKVRVPPSMIKAWELYKEGGWVGSTSSPELGGLGMPESVGTVLNDIFSGANLSFCLVVLLSRGASELIEHHGGKELRHRFCEKMISGEWTGTMCLTEPHAGSDVGASTTRADRQDDGTYLISGEKIFITSGEHDMADNIIHAVLARTPDAPAGTKGLSLFAVPKIWVHEDGSLGDANDVYCAGIEHKLGIHASPTCSIIFGREGACRGYLLGEEGQGMPLMFEMMNAARIEVGVQGAAVAAASYEAARAYAHERVQMRFWDRRAGRKEPQVPIVEHPDVRRMLLTSSAYVQAMRAVLLRTAYYLDRSRQSEGDEKELYRSLVALLTPVCKAWASDWGFRVTEWSMQVYGGYGYTSDYPAEQYLRDVKITSIYEGTNGIQALDFVGRKLPMSNGSAVQHLLKELIGTVAEGKSIPALHSAAERLSAGLVRFSKILGDLPERRDAGLSIMLNAVPIMDCFGALLGGGFLLQQAILADHRLQILLTERGIDPEDAEGLRAFLTENERATQLHNKIQSAVLFNHRAVPPAVGQLVAAESNENASMEAIL